MSNQSQAEQAVIPRRLDDPPRFLWWEFDQAILFILLFGLGITSGFIGTGAVVGGSLSYFYGRLKSGKHPRFAVHLMYWYLPSDKILSLKVTPPSHYREFIG